MNNYQKKKAERLVKLLATASEIADELRRDVENEKSEVVDSVETVFSFIEEAKEELEGLV